MAVIVVAVNGTLSYAELPPSGPQQLAEARRINPSKILTTYLFSFALPGPRFPFITVSRFMRPRRRKSTRSSVPTIAPPLLREERLTKPEHEPFIFHVVIKRGEKRERKLFSKLRRDWRTW